MATIQGKQISEVASDRLEKMKPKPRLADVLLDTGPMSKNSKAIADRIAQQNALKKEVGGRK